jgi:hypothetical protein
MKSIISAHDCVILDEPPVVYILEQQGVSGIRRRIIITIKSTIRVKG